MLQSSVRLCDQPLPPAGWRARLPRLPSGGSAARRVLVAGTLAATLLAAYIAYWEWRGVQEEIRELAAERTELLASTMNVSLQVLYSLRSLHAATAGIEPRAFTAFARDVRRRHPELLALEWAPRVAAAAKEAFETRLRADGMRSLGIIGMLPDGSVAPAAERPEYFPVWLIEPLAGNEPALGLDLAQDSRRGAAVERARQTRQAAATAPIRLAQGSEDRPGFLVVLPVYSPANETTPRSEPVDPEGFALAVYRFDDLIRHAMRDMDGRGIAFTIDDISDQPVRRVYGTTPVESSIPAWFGPAGLWAGAAWRSQLPVAGRSWQLRFVPESGFVWRHLPWQTVATFACGLLISILLAGFIRLLARRNADVARANTALRAEVIQRENAVEAAVAASRSKSTFLANLSHEIRTPMNAVLGYAQLLRRDDRLDESQRDAVNAIVTSGSHLMNQINEVLDFSKIESGRLELNRIDFDLNASLRDLARMMRPRCEEKLLRLDVQGVPDALSWVHGDVVKVQQVLINLLGNAVRFTSVGEVAVRVQAQGGDRYRFDVIDTGPGIPPDQRERIFEPFYQLPTNGVSGGVGGVSGSGGSGLGLAIARRQAELMGGSLSVAGEPGTGSVFTFLAILPAATSSLQSTRRSEQAIWRLSAGRRLSVLVIDDVAANRDVLVRLLRDAGCQADATADGPGALTPDTDGGSCPGGRADVVFVDMRMPGMDGLMAIGALKRLRPTPKVIAYSAAAFEQDRQRFLAAGCDGVVSKPIDTEHLFNTLQQISDGAFERLAIVADEPAPLREPDFSRLRVSRDLLQRLVTAAELHSATVLKSCLIELRDEGPEQRLLADHLRQHLRAYDMNSALRLLMQVSEAGSNS